MKPRKTLDFYFDFTSPYAYLAATQIDALASNYNYSVRWHPFLIGVALSITGRKPSLDIPMVDTYVLNDIQRTARELSIELIHPKKFPILSVKAGCLFCYLSQLEAEQKTAKAFALVAFQQYFVEGKDISSLSVLEQLAPSFGIYPDEVGNIINLPQIKDHYRAGVDAAIEKKVFAAPMFDVGGELFWGVDHLPQLERWLKLEGW